jgi:hypothetical protein
VPIQVSDSASNRNEQIENAAKAIGASHARRVVFDEIHFGKSSVKTVQHIADRTGLSRKQVLNAARVFVSKQIVDQLKKDGDTAYAKNDFLQAHRAEVMSIAGNKAKLAAYPTKRKTQTTGVVRIELPAPVANIEQITVDDIANFKKVQGINSSENLPAELSESEFKNGIKSILGEPGAFKDWGGERNDLLTTRLVVAGRRRTAAFAFKGPGMRAKKLTPARLGTNGDQIQRLFLSPSDIFLVQYWREIDESVLEQLRAFATAKSATSRQKVWFGIIDGYDSRRVYDAYRVYFPK